MNPICVSKCITCKQLNVIFTRTQIVMIHIKMVAANVQRGHLQKRYRHWKMLGFYLAVRAYTYLKAILFGFHMCTHI